MVCLAKAQLLPPRQRPRVARVNRRVGVGGTGLQHHFWWGIEYIAQPEPRYAEDYLSIELVVQQLWIIGFIVGSRNEALL